MTLFTPGLKKIIIEKHKKIYNAMFEKILYLILGNY